MLNSTEEGKFLERKPLDDSPFTIYPEDLPSHCYNNNYNYYYNYYYPYNADFLVIFVLFS